MGFKLGVIRYMIKAYEREDRTMKYRVLMVMMALSLSIPVSMFAQAIQWK